MLNSIKFMKYTTYHDKNSYFNFFIDKTCLFYFLGHYSNFNYLSLLLNRYINVVHPSNIILD